jgi:ring-1,2-phenylacetyl-CoA epoxidase subunit PaaD
MTSSRETKIREAISGVQDPEVPVTLTDLGVIRAVRVDESVVHILLRPTRLACPARGEMARRVKQAVLGVDPTSAVAVDWEMVAWAGEDVSTSGRLVLLESGYSDPATTTRQCPYCGSTVVRSEGAFGGAVCKLPFTCRDCGSTFDALRGQSPLRAGTGH